MKSPFHNNLFCNNAFCGVAVLIISAEDDEEALLKKYKHNKKLKKYNQF